MILKTADLLYLFDFDGTIAGSDDWVNYIKNCKLSFQHLHINPDSLDIRWCILTSRPRMDHLFIKMVCRYYKLHPKQIIMGPTWRWKFKNIEQESNYKEQIIKSILDGSFDIKYANKEIKKVCYIDNNENIVKLINDNRGDYRYLAMSVADLITKNYVQLLS